MSLVAYRRALASYVEPGANSWMLWLLAAGWTWVLVDSSWIAWPVAMTYVSFLAAMHLVLRLASYRGRLLPDYRQVQLAALTTICLAALVGLSIAMRVWPGGATVAPLGAMVLACALGCWLIRWRFSFVPLFFGPVLGFSHLTAEARRAAYESLQSPAIDLAVCAFGAGLLGLFAWWAWNLTDEQGLALPFPGVLGVSGAGGWNLRGGRNAARKQMSAGWFGRPASDFLLRPGDWRLEVALRRGPGSFGWRVRRWLLPWQGGALLVCFLLAMAVMMALTRFYGRFRPPAHAQPVTALTLGPFMLAAMFIPLMSFRRRSLGIESLRPVTRAQFLRQQGAGLLVQWFAAVLLVIGMMWLSTARREFLPQANAWGFIDMAALLLATQLIVFAIVAWTLRSKSEVANLAAMMIVVALASIASELVSQVWAMDFQSWWPLVLAAAIAAGGGVLLWGVYWSWLVTDLD